MPSLNIFQNNSKNKKLKRQICLKGLGILIQDIVIMSL